MTDGGSPMTPGLDDDRDAGLPPVIPIRGNRRSSLPPTLRAPDSLFADSLDDLDDDHPDDQLVAVREPNQYRYAWRILLAMVCVLVAAISIPMIIAINPFPSAIGAASNEHLTRDGALGLITATAGALTAWRPRWAAAMTCCCVAVLALQLVGGLHDGHDDDVTLRFEAIHVAVLVIAALVAFGALRRQYVPAPRRR